MYISCCDNAVSKGKSMAQIKRIIVTSAEVMLDTLLDTFFPYKALSKTSVKNWSLSANIKLSYIFNQKFQRMQILDQLHQANIDNPIRMKAWWSRGLNNFGDELLAYLLAHIAGVDCTFDRKKNMLAIGSIIRFAQDHSYVWGSGIIKKSEIIKHKPKCLAVRGPLTRQKMLDHGVSCPQIYGDPAMLFPLFFLPPKPYTKEKVLIVPHFKHKNLVQHFDKFDYADLHVHSIYDIENIIAQIASAPCVLTSSLHGFIFAVAYGVPVAVFRLEKQGIGGDNIKFDDFCHGIGIEPITIHAIDDEDESQFEGLVDKAILYKPDWSPVPLLKSLQEICPTQTLSDFIHKIKSNP